MTRALQVLPHRVHFVGIGGVGMSAIALVLRARGHDVSGSDAAEGLRVQELRERGVRICIGHAPANLGEAEAVLHSTAIRPDNPEVIEAKRRGLPMLHRSLGLAAIFDASVGVGVAGTHGKTTTTGMLGLALWRAGDDPTILIGSEIKQFGSNTRIGQGPHVVAEVDESDGSLLNLHPRWSIILNLDLDHMDHYTDEDHLQETFQQYMAQIDPEGGAIVWHDDARLAAIRRTEPCPVWTYSAVHRQADYVIDDLRLGVEGTSFSVHHGDEQIARVRLQVPGAHNALNATAVVAQCHRLGLDLRAVEGALAEFAGTRRRFQLRGEVGGVRVVDDYAHHPTEIRATLEAARSVHRGRIIALFQPHRFTRTAHLWREFAEALGAGADAVVITDVYSAGEDPIPGIDARLIHDALPRDCRREHCPTLDDAVDHLAKAVMPGDLVLTLGAGDVLRAGEMLVERLGGEVT